jgi:hypothetical protein
MFVRLCACVCACVCGSCTVHLPPNTFSPNFCKNWPSAGLLIERSKSGMSDADENRARLLIRGFRDVTKGANTVANLDRLVKIARSNDEASFQYYTNHDLLSSGLHDTPHGLAEKWLKRADTDPSIVCAVAQAMINAAGGGSESETPTESGESKQTTQRLFGGGGIPTIPAASKHSISRQSAPKSNKTSDVSAQSSGGASGQATRMFRGGSSSPSSPSEPPEPSAPATPSTSTPAIQAASAALSHQCRMAEEEREAAALLCALQIAKEQHARTNDLAKHLTSKIAESGAAHTYRLRAITDALLIGMFEEDCCVNAHGEKDKDDK